MSHRKLVSSACLVIALTGTSALAQTVTLGAGTTGLPPTDAPRVVRTVDARDVVTLAKSHAAFLGKAKTGQALDASVHMNHLQLILKRSAVRQAASAQLVNDQHNPSSLRFRHWLTPREYGNAFGVADGDVAAVTSWLSAEGFKINAVYPNRMQIDFSGTVGLVNHVFHVNETRYTFTSGVTMVTNDGDISVPAALQAVVAGVSGLSKLESKANARSSVTGSGAAFRTNVSESQSPFSNHATRGQGQVVDPGPGYPRLLVPNDLVTMYGMRTLRNNGVVGSGVKVAVIVTGTTYMPDWSMFTNLFNLTRYGGTATQEQPAGPSACPASDYQAYSSGISDAEWITAMAPGADVMIASCGNTSSGDYFSGIYAAANNLINADARPNVIEADYVTGEYVTSQADKLAIDLLWEQADAEGISVFVPTGDYGSGQMLAIEGQPGVDANAFATSPHVTAVGGTDIADQLDGTTTQYFAAVPSVVGGSALSYVPEIPWNQSCGNGVVAKHLGYNRVVGYCNASQRNPSLRVRHDPLAAGGASSKSNPKPDWQTWVYNSAQDQTRDIPDVALFAGSHDDLTSVFSCVDTLMCTFQEAPGYSYGTSISTATFVGIQAVMDEGLASRGYPIDQGNAAPTLYALASDEYGRAFSQPAPGLAACNADHGATGSSNCIFHNITRGSISTSCQQTDGIDITPNCYFYNFLYGPNDTIVKLGVTTIDASPTAYDVDNKAYGARPGWSFASGLGSVNATNLLIAWRAFAKANDTLP